MDMVAADHDPVDLQRGIFFRLPAVGSEHQYATCPEMMQMIVPESQVAAGGEHLDPVSGTAADLTVFDHAIGGVVEQDHTGDMDRRLHRL